jgi:hypothetical protein
VPQEEVLRLIGQSSLRFPNGLLRLDGDTFRRLVAAVSARAAAVTAAPAPAAIEGDTPLPAGLSQAPAVVADHFRAQRYEDCYLSLMRAVEAVLADILREDGLRPDGWRGLAEKLTVIEQRRLLPPELTRVKDLVHMKTRLTAEAGFSSPAFGRSMCEAAIEYYARLSAARQQRLRA